MRNATPVVQQLTRQQKDVRKLFQSAKSGDEMLKRFKQMESCFHESELGIKCWLLAKKFHDSPEKVLSFGKRSLNILIANYDYNIHGFGKRSSIISGDDGYGSKCIHNHSSSFYIACVCNLLGIVSLELKRYDESLSYWNWANRNLTKLEDDEKENSRCTANGVLRTLQGTQLELFSVNVAMGRKQETVVPMKKIMEIMDKTMEEGSFGLAKAYKILFDAYLIIEEFQESLPFTLKALEIYTKHGVGDDSVELAHVRRNLGTIYAELGEHDKALELTQLSLNGLKRMDRSSEWVSAQIGVGNMLTALGRNEEGLDALNSLLPLTETEGYQRIRAFLLTCMPRGFFNLGKLSDARNYMKIATRVLEKKQICPDVAAIVFEVMSRVYEEMKEYEPAMSNLRRALAIPDLPQKNLIASSSRLFSLISLTGNDKKGIPYLEEVVERLKEKLGQENCQVGYCYKNLGVSYRRLGKLEPAAECFVRAKDVLDVSLGPHHLDSLKSDPFDDLCTNGTVKHISDQS